LLWRHIDVPPRTSRHMTAWLCAGVLVAGSGLFAVQKAHDAAKARAEACVHRFARESARDPIVRRLDLRMLKGEEP
jgi:hypothetical protein